MAIILALQKLYTDVLARFALDGTFGGLPGSPAAAQAAAVANPFGWREPTKQLRPTRRIVWVPGDVSGSAGHMLPARYPGRNPRPLATLGELFHVDIHAQDSTAPENELLQYAATRQLFDAWMRAVYLSAHGTFEIVNASWVTSSPAKNERRFGATLRVTGVIQSMIPDAPLTAAPVDLDAEIDVTELDVTETVTIEGPPTPSP